MALCEFDENNTSLEFCHRASLLTLVLTLLALRNSYWLGVIPLDIPSFVSLSESQQNRPCARRRYHIVIVCNDDNGRNRPPTSIGNFRLTTNLVFRVPYKSGIFSAIIFFSVELKTENVLEGWSFSSSSLFALFRMPEEPFVKRRYVSVFLLLYFVIIFLLF